MVSRTNAKSLNYVKIWKKPTQKLYDGIKARAIENDKKKAEKRKTEGFVGIEPHNGVVKPYFNYKKTIKIGRGRNLNSKKPWMPASDWYLNYCKRYERLKNAKTTQKSSKKG